MIRIDFFPTDNDTTFRFNVFINERQYWSWWAVGYDLHSDAANLFAFFFNGGYVNRATERFGHPT